MDGDDVHLSAATIAALKEFAMARGIVEDDDYEGEMDEEEGNEADIIERVRRHYEVKDRDEVFQFKYGDIEFSLKGVKRELGQTLSSTGLTLWRAAEHLSEFCHAHPHRFNDKTIVELGAGLGNVSILIDKLQVATMIVTTDGDDDTMELLASNLLSMKSNIVLRKLWWGEVSQFLEEFPDKFEVVLAADVIYEDEQVEPLLNTARELLRADGVFYLAYARRNISIDKVLRVAAEIGFNWDVIEDGNGQEPIYVLRISE